MGASRSPPPGCHTLPRQPTGTTGGSFALFFHMAAFSLTLYTLYVSDYTLDSIKYFLTGWNLLLALLLHTLHLLHHALACCVPPSRLAALHWLLSLVSSASAALCTGMTVVWWSLRAAGLESVPAGTHHMLLDHLKHTVPIALTAMEVTTHTHRRLSPWLERGVCVLPAVLFLCASYHKRHFHAAREYPYPFMARLPHFGAFAAGMLTFVAALVVALQRGRNALYKKRQLTALGAKRNS